MNGVDYALARLKTEEGFRGTKYLDQNGLITIGYGFCVDRGVTPFVAAATLQAQIQEADQQLQSLSWYQNLDPARQSVILDMAINDGIHGMLQFVHMIAALTNGDWQTAHDELLDSAAARALPVRYNALAQILLTGAV